MKKKAIAMLLTAATAATLLAGCGSSQPAASQEKPAEATEATEEAAEEEAPAEETAEATETAAGEISGELNLIHYLTENNKLSALDELVNGFMQEYPNVKVNTEALSMDNYSDVIKLRFSTDEAPDIIFGQPKSNADLIDNGLIMPITDQDFVSRLSDSSKTTVTYKDDVYVFRSIRWLT